LPGTCHQNDHENYEREGAKIPGKGPEAPVEYAFYYAAYGSENTSYDAANRSDYASENSHHSAEEASENSHEYSENNGQTKDRDNDDQYGG